ncbi:MAG: phosphopantetheine-binding protein, partial [Cyanobacteria bacterium P01_F01_bin.4]
PRNVSITDTLRKHLSATLPSYMVPTRYQILEAIPLSANGKVDRRALPAHTLGATTEYVAPTTPAEVTIVELWQTLLEIERIGVNDNFFEVGGNSLTAIQLLSQLQQAFAVEMTIAQLFGAMTPALQAQLVEQPNAASKQEAIQPAPRQPALPAIDDLSDAAVDDLLAQLLVDDNSGGDSPTEDGQTEDSQEVTP